ncbi:MAG: DUF948 domain-containing protein [Chloroflexota bacterium]|nr:DUF948 domain-containing protein [Chloroflexota bacterium]
MDVAVLIFNVGVGLGVLLVGAGLLLLAIRVLPLIRETQTLVREARAVVDTADPEIGPILRHAREVGANVELLSEDVAVKLDRLTDLMNALQQSVDSAQVTAAPHRQPLGSVESWDRESWDTQE